MFRVSFLPLDENTTLIQFRIHRAMKITRILQRIFALTRFLDTKFIGLGFTTVEPSLEVLSRALFDMVLCFLFE